MESSFFEYRDQSGVEVESDSDTDIIEESLLEDLMPKTPHKTPMRTNPTIVPDSEESLVYDGSEEERDTPQAPKSVARRSITENHVIGSSDDDVSRQSSRQSQNMPSSDVAISSDEEEASPELVPKRRPPTRPKSLNSTSESPMLRRVKKRMILLDSDTDNSIILEKNKTNKMACLKDTPLKLDVGKHGKVNDSEESEDSDEESGSDSDASHSAMDDDREASLNIDHGKNKANHSESDGSHDETMDGDHDKTDSNNDDHEKDETDDDADEDQMVMSRATRMSIMGIIPKQNESDESDFIESDDSVKRSIGGSTESLDLPAVRSNITIPLAESADSDSDLPEVNITTRTPRKLKSPEKPVKSTQMLQDNTDNDDSVLTCSPIASPLRDVTNEFNNSVSNSPPLPSKKTPKIQNKALKDRVLKNIVADDKKTTSYYDGEVTVIDDVKEKPFNKTASVLKKKSNSYYNGEVTVVDDGLDNARTKDTCNDDEVAVIESAPEVIMLSSDEEEELNPPKTAIKTSPKPKSPKGDNTIKQYLPPPSYPNQVVYVQKHMLDNELSKLNSMQADLHNVRNLLDNMDVSTLPDGGSKLITRLTELEVAVRKQGDLVGNMVVEPSQPTPADVARDGYDQGLSWDNLQKASHAVQPRMFGKQAMSTHLAERNLILDRLRDLHSALDSRPSEDKLAQAPAAMKTELMPHQKHALAWLRWREALKPHGGILADDMGLGKTITMISLIAGDRELGGDDEEESDDDYGDVRPKGKLTNGGTLVVCPASLMTQWEGEVKKHCLPHRVTTCLHHGASRATQPQRLAHTDIVLTTYNLLQRDSEKNGVLMRILWRRVILDEAHMVRNYKSATSRAVCGLRARRRWALTGTPLHNKDLDLFALLKFLRCTPFDDLTMWKKWIDNKSQGGQERLSTIMRCIMLRRTKAQLQAKGQLKDLPARTAHQCEVTLTKDEMNVYQKVLVFSKTLFAQFLHQRAEKVADGFLPRANQKDSAYYEMHKKMIALQGAKPVKAHEILVLLLRLRQVCCHCGLIAAMLDADDAEPRLQEDEADKDLLAELHKLSLDDSKRKSKEQDTQPEPEEEGTTAAEAIRSVLSPNNPVFQRTTRSSKIQAVMDCLNKNVLTNKGEKAVVVSQWTSVLSLVEAELRAARVRSVTLSGAVPVPARAALVNALNDPKSDVRVRTQAVVVSQWTSVLSLVEAELRAARVRSVTLSGAVPVPARAALVNALNDPKSDVRVRTQAVVVSQWTAVLSLVEAELRAARVRSVTLSGAVPVPARAALVNALNDPKSDVRVRTQAVVVSQWTAVLSLVEAELRAARVRSVTLSGAVPVPARAALVNALNDPKSDVRVRTQAVVVSQWTAVLSLVEAELRAARVRSVTLSGAVPVPARAALVNALNDPKSDVRVRTQAVVVSQWTAVLSLVEAELRAARVRSVTLSGAVPVPARAALVNALNDPKSDVRVRTQAVVVSQWTAVLSLVEAELRAARVRSVTLSGAVPVPARAALVNALNDPKSDVRVRTQAVVVSQWTAVLSLVEAELRAARVRSVTLSGAVPVPARAALVNALNDPKSDVRVRTQAVVVSQWTAVLSLVEAELRAARVRSVTLSGAVPVPARAALVNALNDPKSDVRVRTQAVVVSQWTAVLSLVEAELRAARVRSVTLSGAVPVPARAALVNALNDPKSDVRVRTQAVVVSQWTSVLSLVEAELRAARVRSVTLSGAVPVPARAALVNALNDHKSDVRVRTQAVVVSQWTSVLSLVEAELRAARVRSVTLSGAVPVPARAALVNALNDPKSDVRVRTQAVVVSQWTSVLSLVEAELRAARVRSVTLSGAVPVPARAALVNALNDPKSDVRVRTQAVVVSQWTSVLSLVEAELRAARVRSVTLSGAVPVPARAALVNALNDPKSDVRVRTQAVVVSQWTSVLSLVEAELRAARVRSVTLSGAVPVPARAALVNALNDPKSDVRVRTQAVVVSQWTSVLSLVEAELRAARVRSVTLSGAVPVPARAALVNALNDPKSDVRVRTQAVVVSQWTSVLSLVEAELRAARVRSVTLSGAVPVPARAALVNALNDPKSDVRVRTQAVVVSQWTSVLSLVEAELRAARVRSVTLSGAVPVPARAALVNALNDHKSDVRVRTQAVVVSQWTSVLSLVEAELRAARVRSVTLSGAVPVPARAALVNALNDPKSDVRVRTQAVVVSQWTSVLSLVEAELRAARVRSVTLSGAVPVPARAALVNALNDPKSDVRVRTQAVVVSQWTSVLSLVEAELRAARVRSVTLSGAVPVPARAALVNALNDPKSDVRVRTQAVVVSQWTSVLSLVEAELRAARVRSVTLSGAVPVPARAALVNALNDPKSDVRVRTQAVVVSQWTSVLSLVEAELRAARVRSVTLSGAVPVPARAALVNALNDPKSDVRVRTQAVVVSQWTSVLSLVEAELRAARVRSVTLSGAVPVPARAALVNALNDPKSDVRVRTQAVVVSQWTSVLSLVEAELRAARVRSVTLSGAVPVPARAALVNALNDPKSDVRVRTQAVVVSQWTAVLSLVEAELRAARVRSVTLSGAVPVPARAALVNALNDPKSDVRVRTQAVVVSQWTSVLSLVEAELRAARVRSVTLSGAVPVPARAALVNALNDPKSDVRVRTQAVVVSQWTAVLSLVEAELRAARVRSVTLSGAVPVPARAALVNALNDPKSDVRVRTQAVVVSQWTSVLSLVEAELRAARVRSVTLSGAVPVPARAALVNALNDPKSDVRVRTQAVVVSQWTAVLSLVEAELRAARVRSVTLSGAVPVPARAALVNALNDPKSDVRVRTQAVVVSQWTSVLSLVEAELRAARVRSVTLSGAVPVPARAALVNALNDPKSDVRVRTQAVVVSQWTAVLSLVEAELRAARVRSVTLSGAVPVPARAALVNALNDPKSDVRVRTQAVVVSQWTAVLSLVEAELRAARVRSVTLSGAVPVPARAALVNALNDPKSDVRVRTQAVVVSQWTAVLSLVEAELRAARVRSVTLSGAVPVPARAALVNALNDPKSDVRVRTQAVVVSQWTSVLSLVEAELRAARVRSVTLSGAVPVPARAALVNALNDPKSDVRVRTQAVVVSQWTSVLSLVEAELRAARVRSVTLSGAVPVPARAALVNALNDHKSDVRVMLLSLCAGGVGLNLCGANHLLLLDPHWNPQLEEQAQDRVYRVGQTKPVHVYRFMCVDTVEQSIRKLQDAKLEMAANVLTGARHNSASKLSIEDLKVLFNMGPTHAQ